MNAVENYFSTFKAILDNMDAVQIQNVIEVLHKARIERRLIFIMGNGGSASTASHFVCDLAKNTRLSDLPHFRVVGLADNMAILSAYANDEGFENVFVHQLATLVKEGDIVIGISTSGKSQNVLNAVELANQIGAVTIGFTGFDAGKLGSMVDYHIHVPSDCIEQVEDIHLLLEHLITKSLRELDFV